MALKKRRNFPPWPLSDGQKGMVWKNAVEHQEAWMNEVLEVQTWKEEGAAGAVMCETRALGSGRIGTPRCSKVT